MANMSWKTVTFQEGQPFDPNDLNQLQANLTQVFSQNKALENAFKVGTDQTLQLSANSVSVTVSTINTMTKVDLPIDTKFGGKTPSYIVSLGSALNNKDVISVGSALDGGKPFAYIVSNRLGTFTINFIAFTV